MEHPLVLFLAPEIALNGPACTYRHRKMDYGVKREVGNKEFQPGSYQSHVVDADFLFYFWVGAVLPVCHLKHNYELR